MILCTRSELKLVPKSGAIMELYVTGIRLEVPHGAFNADTIVELSILEPSTTPEFHVDIGETVIGDIIRVGPADIKFNTPARLSIPNSIVDVPEHSSICISHFDEKSKQWVQISKDASKPSTFGNSKVLYFNIGEASVLYRIYQ